MERVRILAGAAYREGGTVRTGAVRCGAGLSPVRVGSGMPSQPFLSVAFVRHG